jgi:hypothetical protein
LRLGIRLRWSENNATNLDSLRWGGYNLLIRQTHDSRLRRSVIEECAGRRTLKLVLRVVFVHH